MYKIWCDYEEPITESNVEDFLASKKWKKVNRYLENKILSLEVAMIKGNDLTNELLSRELYDARKYLKSRIDKIEKIKLYPEKMKSGITYEKSDLIIP